MIFLIIANVIYCLLDPVDVKEISVQLRRGSVLAVNLKNFLNTLTVNEVLTSSNVFVDRFPRLWIKLVCFDQFIILSMSLMACLMHDCKSFNLVC